MRLKRRIGVAYGSGVLGWNVRQRLLEQGANVICVALIQRDSRFRSVSIA